MVKAIIDLREHQNRVLNIVKGKEGLRNKTEAMLFIIDRYEEEFLEPTLRPSFIKKMKRLETEGTFTQFKTLRELRRAIENA